MFQFKTGIALAAICALTLSCTKSENAEKPAAESNTILVGEYGSMTGAAATFGQGTHHGIQLAFEEQNKLGGVKGKKLELFTEDDGSRQNAKLAVGFSHHGDVTACRADLDRECQ